MVYELVRVLIYAMSLCRLWVHMATMLSPINMCSADRRLVLKERSFKVGSAWFSVNDLTFAVYLVQWRHPSCGNIGFFNYTYRLHTYISTTAPMQWLTWALFTLVQQ